MRLSWPNASMIFWVWKIVIRLTPSAALPYESSSIMQAAWLMLVSPPP